MAVMNKMREKMTVIFAGLAGAFLLMIIFEWGAQGDFFKGNGPKQGEDGKVNGIPIMDKEYQDIITQMRQQKLQQDKKTTLSEIEENDLREKAWDEIIKIKLYEQKMDEYGITVTDQEVRDFFYYTPPDFLRRSFTDSLGRFDQESYFAALRDPRNAGKVDTLSNEMRKELRKQKLFTVIQNAVTVTRSDMWDRFDIMNSKATFDAVKIKPAKPAREFLSSITDDDVKKYYDEHPYLYKRDESRKIKFVVFRELPTAKDSVMLLERVDGLKKKWAAMPVTASDSAVSDFARDYTDLPYQAPIVMPPAAFNQYSNSDSILNGKTGDVLSTFSQGQIKVIRIVETFDTASASCHFRNLAIAFGNPQNKDSAKALAQKLYNDIKAGADFAATARQYSADPSARNGGDMHWMGKGVYLHEVDEVVQKAPIGELMGPIESTFGYHIVQVLGRTNKSLKIATISIAPKTSSTTQKSVLQAANLFRQKASDIGFDQAAAANNLHVTADAPPVTKKSQPMFGYTPWVNYLFELSSGDITQPVRIPNAKLLVVGQVSEVLPEGTKPLDSVIKDQIKGAIAKRKAVEAMAQKAKELRAMLNSGDDLSKLMSVDSNYKPVNIVTGPAESTPGLGTEYAVNNAAFAMKPGEISQPIEGTEGFYIIKLSSLKPADKKEYDAQKTKEFESLSQEKQQRFFGQWIENLKQKATVVDYRSHRM
jgi:parvulin-like peptidyl-prolyl isomerase